MLAPFGLSLERLGKELEKTEQVVSIKYRAKSCRQQEPKKNLGLGTINFFSVLARLTLCEIASKFF